MRIPIAGKKSVQILIDNGSTHDFLDLMLAKKLGWHEEGYKGEYVQVVGDRRLRVHGIWQDFRWKMQGLEFTCDLRIIEL